jgi:hypothetical protein
MPTYPKASVAHPPVSEIRRSLTDPEFLRKLSNKNREVKENDSPSSKPFIP